MDWHAYDRWNDALAEVIFSSDAAGQPVYLDLEEATLTEAGVLAGASSDPRQDLVDAVRRTIDPDDPTESLRAHLRRLQRWARTTGGEPPPIVALLAVLSLAAEDMQASDGLAANNYYDRLMPLLGVDPSYKARVVNWYREHSFDLWESLNGWLEALRGERGLPTAYAYSHAHIGRPLSQALLRAADREKLEEFFLDAGLEPSSSISPHDMEAMLAEWIALEGSGASQHMRMLWGASQERMTEIACQLLETWEPSAEALARRARRSATSGSPTGLRLLVLHRAFPPSIQVDVIGTTSATEVKVIGTTASGEPAALLVEVLQLGDGRWRLGQTDGLDHRSILEGVLEVELSAHERLQRRPRRVVPMRVDGLLRCFVEVERLGLGEDGRLLARAELASVLDDALSQVARPGFRRSEPAGLPPGWVMFDDVQIVLPLMNVRPTTVSEWPVDLQVLQPISSIQTTLAGGLNLPGRLRRWSSLCPPELRVVADGATSIEVEVHRVRVFAADERVFKGSFAGNVAVLALGDLHLRDGDYQITSKITSNGRTLRGNGSARVRLRSADNPARSDDLPMLHHLVADGAGVLSAVERTPDGPDGIRGLRAPASSGDRSPNGTVPPHPPSWWAARRETPTRPAGAKEPSVRLLRAAPTDCFNTGAHHFVLPTWWGGRAAGSFEGACKFCGMVKRFPATYRARRTGRKRPTVPPTFVREHVPPVAAEGSPDIESAFDALCHDSAGPARWLEQVALQVEASPLLADSMARALEVLGHIEIHRSIRDLTPLSWQVTAPTLARCRGGFALVGHRSRHLVDALRTAASAVGATLDSRSNGVEGPPRIRVNVDDLAVIEQITLEVMDETGLDVDVLDDPTGALLAALPPLSAVVASRPRVSMVEARAVKRWDPNVCRWVSCGDAHRTGIFKLQGSGLVYCSRDELDLEQGTMQVLDAQLAKHVAALRHGSGLLGYDGESRVLYVPLGADLPGLYGRAAVSASGLLPTPDAPQGTLAYWSIDPDVAGALHHLLTT